ncbi:MAG TPA: hypothetical protein VNS09_03620 [Solirubrobacter sp.]|nr:hypothetical protein [Solirubrobacter sp.]
MSGATIDGKPGRLTTAIEEHRNAVRFVVTTDAPLYQDRLVHMGYERVSNERCATRWFAPSPELPRYFARFAASIEPMVLQSARLVRVPWEEALLEFLRRVEGSGLDWWLYGSAALAVRGLDIEPGDLDINVSDAHAAGRVFDDLLVTPVERMHGWAANYTGRAFCHAIIEWIAEPLAEHDDASAPNEQGPLIAERLEVVRWRGHRVRVPPLLSQLRVCERRGLTDRVALIHL